MTTSISSKALWNYKENIWKTESWKKEAQNYQIINDRTKNYKTIQQLSNIFTFIFLVSKTDWQRDKIFKALMFIDHMKIHKEKNKFL